MPSSSCRLRHTDGEISSLPERRGRAGRRVRLDLRLPRGRQGRWARGREGRDGRRNASRGRGGRSRRDGRGPVWRGRLDARHRRVPDRSRGVVLRAVRRRDRHPARHGPGPQAHFRRRRGSQHRRDGRVFTQSAHFRGHGARCHGHHRPARAGWHAAGRGRVSRLSVRRPDADVRRPEGDRVQRAVRRSRGPGRVAPTRRAVRADPIRRSHRTARRRTACRKATIDRSAS